jgi:hypothetical protein
MREHAVARSADSQLVYFLEWRAAAPANKSGAITAHQWIGYGFVTTRAVEFDLFAGHY